MSWKPSLVKWRIKDGDGTVYQQRLVRRYDPCCMTDADAPIVAGKSYEATSIWSALIVVRCSVNAVLWKNYTKIIILVRVNMEEKKIVVVISGNKVQEILGCGDLSDVAVEVIDLDRPAYETPEETVLFDTLDEYVAQLERDPEWVVL